MHSGEHHEAMDSDTKDAITPFSSASDLKKKKNDEGEGEGEGEENETREKQQNVDSSTGRWILDVSEEERALMAPATQLRKLPIWLMILYFPLWLIHTILLVIPLLVSFGISLVVDKLCNVRTGSVNQEASKTAIYVARARHITNIFGICHDNLARYIIPAHQAWSDRILAVSMLWRGHILEGMLNDIAVRCAMADEVVRRFVKRQVAEGKQDKASIVLLGAGMDTKLYRLEIPEQFALFEVDTKPSQAAKVKAIKNANIKNADRVKFCPCDFSSETFIDALKANGWRPETETLFLWEGVTYYLPQQAVDRTFELMQQHCAKGSEVYFDFFNKPKGLKAIAQYRVLKRAVKDRGEPFLSRFNEGSWQEMRDYLSSYNFKLVELINTKDAKKFFLTRDAGKRACGVGSGIFNFAVAHLE